MQQSYICTDSDSSLIAWLAERSERGGVAERKQSGGATILQRHLDLEQSVGVDEVEAIGGEELCGTPKTISEERHCASAISDISQFHDDCFQLTSTPTQSQSPTRPPTVQLNSVSLPAVVDAQSCHGCKALHSVVTAMEINITKLSEMVTELNQRLDQMNKHKINKSLCSKSYDVFTDQRLMRVKAAAFVTGRPISAHMCKQLVLNLYDNEPPSSFDSDDIKSINDHRECRDAQSLSKWAVFDMFSLQELIGRNCLGGGHDVSVIGNAEIKKPFDEFKMHTIKTAVFNIYPQQSEAMRKAVWMKCVEKINSDVRYLFKVSMKKHQWLQLGF